MGNMWRKAVKREEKHCLRGSAMEGYGRKKSQLAITTVSALQIHPVDYDYSLYEARKEAFEARFEVLR